jgi:hypothetical protein
VLHLGAGGRTSGFSDFQFALEQTGDALPIDWASNGWSYQVNGEVNEDWLDHLFETVGQAGFGFNLAGELGDNCPLVADHTNTAWPAGDQESPSYLYLRRDFTMTTGGEVVIEIAVDNDVKVFLDGDDITGQVQGDLGLEDGWLEHEGCADRNAPFVWNPELSAGVHKLAIIARDRGRSTYLDVRITLEE